MIPSAGRLVYGALPRPAGPRGAAAGRVQPGARARPLAPDRLHPLSTSTSTPSPFFPGKHVINHKVIEHLSHVIATVLLGICERCRQPLSPAAAACRLAAPCRRGLLPGTACSAPEPA